MKRFNSNGGSSAPAIGASHPTRLAQGSNTIIWRQFAAAGCFGADSDGTSEIHWPSQFKADNHPTRFEPSPEGLWDRRGEKVLDVTDDKNRQDAMNSLFSTIGYLRF